MHSPNLLLVAFVAILTLSTLTFAEPIPFRGGQVAERDAVAEREATAARQEITGAQVLAERQINIEKYCCLDGCGTCNGEVCEISDCYDWVSLSSPFSSLAVSIDVYSLSWCVALLLSKASGMRMGSNKDTTNVES